MTRHARTIRHTTAHAALLAPLLLAGGCASIDNNAITAVGRPIPAVEQGSVGLIEARGPSFDSLDRSGWATTSIVVEPEAVQHHPTYAEPLAAHPDDTYRQRGAFPTAASATLAGSPGGPQAGEAFLLPFTSAFDVLLAVPRMFADPPLSPVEGVGWDRQRGAGGPTR